MKKKLSQAIDIGSQWSFVPVKWCRFMVSVSIRFRGIPLKFAY